VSRGSANLNASSSDVIGPKDQKSDTSPYAGTGSGQSGFPSISLPKGGGAIRGIGETFAANPVSGTGSFTILIVTSRAVVVLADSYRSPTIRVPGTLPLVSAGVFRCRCSHARLIRVYPITKMRTNPTSSFFLEQKG
jgi:hypothetical protein